MTQNTERKPLAFIRSLGGKQPTAAECAEVVTTDGSGSLHVVPVSRKHLLTMVQKGLEIISQEGVLNDVEE